MSNTYLFISNGIHHHCCLSFVLCHHHVCVYFLSIQSFNNSTRLLSFVNFSFLHSKSSWSSFVLLPSTVLYFCYFLTLGSFHLCILFRSTLPGTFVRTVILTLFARFCELHKPCHKFPSLVRIVRARPSSHAEHPARLNFEFIDFSPW